jgi:hypothetical protein
MSGPVSQHARWNGSDFSVTARLLPHRAFFAASIDVHVDRETKLRTGGVFKLLGEHKEEVLISGSRRAMVLSWGRAAPRSFPVKLTVDEEVVLEGNVQISNWYVAYWPWALIASLLVWQQLR